MNLRTGNPRDIPVLTDVVDSAEPALDIEAAAAKIAVESLALTERLIQRAVEETHTVLRARVLESLRAELPQVIARALSDHLAEANEAPPSSDG